MTELQGVEYTKRCKQVRKDLLRLYAKNKLSVLAAASGIDEKRLVKAAFDGADETLTFTEVMSIEMLR